MSKQIQIGRLAVALLLVFSMAGIFGCGGSGDSDLRDTSAKDVSKTAVTATNPSTPAATPTANPAGKGVETPPIPSGPTTTVQFDETEFDFGVIDAGEKVKHTYKFKNTGSDPLIISNAKGSCGCTVPSWPKTPIPPGATGEILVEFDSKGKSNKQTKRVTITANTEPAQSFLTIKGEVTPAAGGATPAAPQPIKPQSPTQK